ncbi:MAG: hypothetical protein RBT63_00765 [Bdellovibrionales bacterium]|jgi:Tfp pilus assembly ATPase PilU|nr:hypothetical protein [Bdellovibrionales bacterium]
MRTRPIVDHDLGRFLTKLLMPRMQKSFSTKRFAKRRFGKTLHTTSLVAIDDPTEFPWNFQATVSDQRHHGRDTIDNKSVPTAPVQQTMKAPAQVFIVRAKHEAWISIGG